MSRRDDPLTRGQEGGQRRTPSRSLEVERKGSAGREFSYPGSSQHDPQGDREGGAGRDEERTRVFSAPLPEPIVTGSKQKPCLLVLSGSEAGILYPLREGEIVLGRGEEVQLRFRDEGVSRRHLKLVVSPEGRVELFDLDSTNGTYVNGERITAKTLKDGDQILIGTTTLVKFSYREEEEARFHVGLYESAVRDPLTGAYNRRYLMERGEELFRLCAGTPQVLSLILLDVDHFKRINDRWGHLAGDEVLRKVVEIVQGAIRSEDLLGRYGGEEFMILLPRVQKQDALTVAERLRGAIAGTSFSWEGVEIPVTVSMGVASSEEGIVLFPNLIALADQRLYEAKGLGRNRVVG